MPGERMCAVPDLPPLNDRQAAFVREYLASWDARSAAEDAGISLMQSPPASGYNEVIAGRGVMMGAEPLYHRPWPGLNNNGENQNG
jgi:hypothetical protein